MQQRGADLSPEPKTGVWVLGQRTGVCVLVSEKGVRLLGQKWGVDSGRVCATAGDEGSGAVLFELRSQISSLEAKVCVEAKSMQVPAPPTPEPEAVNPEPRALNARPSDVSPKVLTIGSRP
eukprot:3852982-Rhodomonas_salina.2